ncbi:hypothetical protein ARALYDRAFT_909503 [Arabidopsis lyrata subsp. lyrata]|uniref:S-protein homolog n=1 Tax=Arabidopsis lyrata subsp. lyrata TaxID=81972 RepID=D7M7B5_ARALL|nr:hypothetical protein ARALYDRAFT_909503 [Arabidopsis lyrata subsp. lyrata]
MNRLLCFLFVMALYVGLGNAQFGKKNSLHFKNSLSPGKDLSIYCTFNKESLGSVDLNSGETYVFSFHGKFDFKNKIDCNFRKESFYAKIRAFESGTGAFDHGKKNFWDAREDGIYFTHGKKTPKLEYTWISN